MEWANAVCLFALTYRSVQRHTWVLMGPNSKQNAEARFQKPIHVLACWPLVNRNVEERETGLKIWDRGRIDVQVLVSCFGEVLEYCVAVLKDSDLLALKPQCRKQMMNADVSCEAAYKGKAPWPLTELLNCWDTSSQIMKALILSLAASIYQALDKLLHSAAPPN